jgi:hypothetical protein
VFAEVGDNADPSPCLDKLFHRVGPSVEMVSFIGDPSTELLVDLHHQLTVLAAWLGDASGVRGRRARTDAFVDLAGSSMNASSPDIHHHR